jgi:hypothetical protein
MQGYLKKKIVVMATLIPSAQNLQPTQYTLQVDYVLVLSAWFSLHALLFFIYFFFQHTIAVLGIA